jgi:hypothetical protein
MNRIVFWLDVRRRFVAAAMTWRISATLLSTPLIRMNLAWVISAMMRASVVFPLPGGPEKITEGKRSASIARRKSLPGPRMCSWPTNSSSDRGRIRVARGAALSMAAAAFGSSLVNRSCTAKKYGLPSFSASHFRKHRCGERCLCHDLEVTRGGS